MRSLLWIMWPSILLITPLVAVSNDIYQIIIEPKWESLNHREKYSERLGGQWFIVSSFIFKKKSDAFIQLKKLHLYWKGPNLEKLVGSLYRRRLDRNFIPTEEYLISDGKWCKGKQELVLEFEHAEALGSINEFYLVLTIPKELEETVKKGSFDIAIQDLPAPFSEALKHSKLSFSLHDTTIKTVTANTKKLR
jgi:hypothetical protein